MPLPCTAPAGAGTTAGVTAPTTTEIEGRVEHVRLAPVSFLMRSGTMHLADGRLRYTRGFRDRVVVFDAPVSEFHSFAASSWGTGFHLWHGATRHRFAVFVPVAHIELGDGLVSTVAEGVDGFGRAMAATAVSRGEVGRWHDALVPVIAPAPPPGVRVRPPLPPTAFLLTTIGVAVAFTLVFMAVVAAIVLAGR